MAVEFKLPDIGEGVAEGEITKWLVKEGDAIKEDQPMVEVMTDKATVEITSPVTGKVGKILHGDGAVVPVHSVIVILEPGAGAAPAPAAAPATAPAPAPAPASAPAAAPPPAARPAPAAAPAPSPAPAPAARPVSAPAPAADPAPARALAAATAETAAAPQGSKVLAAPATRKLAREMGVELAEVPGSGPHGRVTKEDVKALVGGRAAAPPAPAAATAPAAAPAAVPAPAPAAPAAARAPAPAAPPRAFPPGGEERIPYRGIRKATGDQMVRSIYTAPHFTYVDEVDMTGLWAARKEAAKIAEEQGIKFTFLPFIIKALCSAIRRHPTTNATLDEEKGEIVVKHDIHVGIATDTDRGLMVPVIRNADRKNALELAADLQRLAEAARTGSAKREELIGSTITITSAGSIGGLFATPIINHPEVAILGVYQIKDKPVIKDGQIVPGKIGYLSLTLDHRVVDGGTAARFVNHMKRLLENPLLMVLES